MDRWNQHERRGRRAMLSLVALAAVAVLASVAFAGSSGRTGTVGATELQIPVGPRGTALGGTVSADVTGVEAMFWNPAGVGATGATEALFSHTQYFAGMKLNYAGVVTHAGALGTVGLSAKVLSIGDVQVTTEQAPDGTGEILNPTFSTLGLTWARQFTDRVNFGATASYINESIANNSANGVAFDFGVQYLTGWQGLKVGLTMKNVGPEMQFTGPGFEILTRDPSSDPNAGNRGLSFSSAPFNLPSYFSLSSTIDVMRSSQQSLLALGSYESNNFTGDNVRGGLEWGYRDLFALRGSYFGTFRGTIDGTTGEETFKLIGGDDLYTGVALGAGAKARFGDAGKIGVDLAWRPVRSLFDDVVEVGIKLDF